MMGTGIQKPILSLSKWDWVFWSVDLEIGGSAAGIAEIAVVVAAAADDGDAAADDDDQLTADDAATVAATSEPEL